jgi:NAD(P)-dependent dehydrogenase (short-subunit alcohol dehydrogenase family)
MAGPTLPHSWIAESARDQLSNFSHTAAHAAEVSKPKGFNVNDQKTFLIFGGVGGIGGALSDLLTAEGHTVFATTSTTEKIGQSNLPRERVLSVDVLDHQSIRDAVAAAGSQGLHGVAYCVGTIDIKPLGRTSADDLRASLEINTIGAFIAIQAAAPILAQHQGAIVLFSSIAASRGFSNHVAIGTAKAAVEGLTRSVAAELAPKVRVNAIAPSLTETPLAEPMTKNPKMAETIGAMHPLPRLGHAREMAKAAAFLLSEDSGWMTGQVLHIDGGRSSVEKSR